ncbi:MAG: ABC transporter permease [Firmicutes bacterium]|nr:ABC transporter permease [[Eubacterium] siraeum]MCM1487144.1 ABC transporter permease [Bacillota bacterium]
MLHCIKYEMLSLLRTKVVVFWLLGFPIILGTLFFAAFGSLADNEQDYTQIPVAVVSVEEAPAGFDSMINMLSAGNGALFNVKTRDEADAEELMKKGELDGIIYVGEEITLEVPGSAGIKSGIIKSVLDSFKSRYEIISSTAEKNPDKLTELLENIGAEESFVSSSSNDANSDPYVQYFYNLLAMAGLMGSMMGMYCSINHQANLSPLGARVEVSPVSKIKDILCSLTATLIIHNIFLNIGAVYLVYILRIEFGVPYWVIALVNFLSTLIGDCMGCFIGSISTMKEIAKNGILLGVSLGLCFLSGLMFGGMRLVIEESAPIVNRINPAAVIVDCFYSLCVYGSYEKLWQNIAVLAVWCVLLLTGSFVATRKRKYKSL